MRVSTFNVARDRVTGSSHAGTRVRKRQGNQSDTTHDHPGSEPHINPGHSTDGRKEPIQAGSSEAHLLGEWTAEGQPQAPPPCSLSRGEAAQELFRVTGCSLGIQGEMADQQSVPEDAEQLVHGKVKVRAGPDLAALPGT